LEIVRMLIENGAAIDIKDSKGIINTIRSCMHCTENAYSRFCGDMPHGESVLGLHSVQLPNCDRCVMAGVCGASFVGNRVALRAVMTFGPIWEKVEETSRVLLVRLKNPTPT
jgi:hypothetical protein